MVAGATACAETAKGSAKAATEAREMMNLFMVKSCSETCAVIVALVSAA
jgi:hypothetical protein